MKPLSFESIRNFLRNKKKNTKDGSFGGMDSSFKRSDSFKRISIRKSYLDRGRKRAAMRAKALGATTVTNRQKNQNETEFEKENHYENPHFLKLNKDDSGLIDLKVLPNEKDIKRNVSTTNFVYNDPIDHISVCVENEEENDVIVKSQATKTLVNAAITTNSKSDNYSGESIVIRISADQDNENECIPPTYSIPSTISSLMNKKVQLKQQQHQQHQNITKESIDSALENLNTVSSVSINKSDLTYKIQKTSSKKISPPPKPPRKAFNAPSRSSSFSEFHFQVKPKVEKNSNSTRFLEESAEDEEHDYHSYTCEPENEIYNDVHLLSSDSTIPYPLRVKTNPFTMQKELYAVNLGRIWKQLNLGQGDIESTNNLRRKNESFKSMSSKDSGFSLTLSKPDFSLTRSDKIIICRNSCKRRRQQANNCTSKNERIFKEFEEFCIARRKQLKSFEYNNFILNKELSDLEAFFEEHLQRLKKYYIQKKNLNEHILNASNNIDDFIFPHPDKRNKRQEKHQQHHHHQRTKSNGKLHFQEVRTFLKKEEVNSNKIYSGNTNSEERSTYEIFNYPKHWRMTASKSNNSSRSFNRYKRQSSRKKGRKIEIYKSRKEISLENVFPSINNEIKATDKIIKFKHEDPINLSSTYVTTNNQTKKTCWICYKNKSSNKCKCNSLPNDCDCSCTSDTTYHHNFHKSFQQLELSNQNNSNFIDFSPEIENGNFAEDFDLDQLCPTLERRKMNKRKSKRRNRRIAPANKNHLTLRRKRGNIGSTCK